MKKANISLIIGVLSLLIYPISIYGSVIVALVAIAICFLPKQENTLHKTLQPVILLTSVVCVKGLFSAIFGIIASFAAAENYNAEVISDVANLTNILDGILLIFVLCYALLSIVFVALNKDIPVVSTWANKLAGVSNTKQTKTEDKPEDSKPKE